MSLFARKQVWLALSLVMLALLSCGAPQEGEGAPPALETEAVLPSGFEDALVAKLSRPTALAFTPDGRLLITTQAGQLRVYEDGALRAEPALDLRSKLCTDSERGLLGVAVDPNFSSNSFVYLFYTLNKFGSCERNAPNAPVNRVSRFTLSNNAASTERVLLDNIPSPNGNHNGGDLHIGKDGLLYVSIGDGGCDYLGDSGCAGENDASRDTNTLLGKVVRITRDGGVPSSNPFRGANSARCNAGNARPGKACQEAYARGLRNPFRLAFDPNSSGTRFFINDVGQNTREEIDLGQAGADYGWNVREGACKNGGSDCGAPPEGFTNPEFDYARASDGVFSGCGSITGGAFVPKGVWPATFEGAYLFSDYVCGKIFSIKKTNGKYSASVLASGLGSSSAVHLTFGPYKGSQALYYTSYADGGAVRRIAYGGPGNRAPQAALSATPTSGQAPLTVRFDASGSRDPEGGALLYRWAFGDGGAADGKSVSHTYKASGAYTATLTVRDPQGAEGKATLRISVGNTPPEARITAPSKDARFGVGEKIVLRGEATDAEDGALSGNRLSWTALLHHNNDHTHPYSDATTGQEISVTMPAPEDLAATSGSFLEVRLTVTDSGGLSRTVSQNIYPAKVDVTFQTQPTGLELKVNGETFTAPKTLTSWKGYALHVSAPDQTTSSGQATFRAWSDGGAASHTITTPAAAKGYTASFDVKAAQKVTSLTLINAETGKPVAGFDPIPDGATLNLSTLPTRRLNIRANTSPSRVGSVRFVLDGQSYQLENNAPYALAGNRGSTYYAWTPSVGSHTLRVTPYSASGGKGSAGTAKTVDFKVVER